MTARPLELVEHGHARYPHRLRERLGAEAPECLSLHGAADLLCSPLVAVFGSARLPPDLVVPACDLGRALRDRGLTVVSGFQSPIEREWLEILLGGGTPVVVCTARGIDRPRMRRAWMRASEEGRFLLVSREGPRVRRATARVAEARNRLVAALADVVWIAHATPGGRLHRLAREVAARGQPLATFDHPDNSDLLLLGARPLDPLSPGA